MPRLTPCSVAVALVLLSAVPLAARDPWFPDGPIEPQIPHDVILPPKVRTPQFRLKTARTLHTDADIAAARANVAHYPGAKAIADHIIAEANYWADWSDQSLYDLVTTAEVPRAVELSNLGCPVHGRAIFEVNGGSAFPWIVDPKHPFKVKCPVGGETYPDNDYGAYYRSGFKDKSLLVGKIVDDGWGWVAPNGERYWFVAHANHLVWQRLDRDGRSILNAIELLGRAYVLTGNRLYAHKAAILFRRVAEVYPNMNHEQQSRFGQLMAAQGTRYPGKIVNLIWEAYQVAPELSEAYDNIWETIDTDASLQKFYHQSGEQIRSCIEANYLEEAIDCYFADKMRGNYGTHQAALLELGVVRQYGENERYVAEILHRPEGHMLRIGFDYALYNLVYRDGDPHESPDYNFIWTKVLGTSADLLGKLGYDLTTLPRLKRMFDAPLDFIAIGSHSPALGDSRTRYEPVIGDDPLTYRRGLKLYGDPRYAAFLAGIGATGAKSFASYDMLFFPPLPAAPAMPGGRVVPPQPSHILSGYGYAFLNNPTDTCSVGMFYGLHVAHYHHDRLHFDLFANGQAMTPALGYPDGANEFNSGIFTWSKATVAHNTVTVDAHRQAANPTGRLRLFADGPFARAMTADALGTYPQTTAYGRTMVMVDVPDAPGTKARAYVVDFFDVAGGRQHDYSLHGPTGKFTALGGTWSAREPGTLAGPQVAVGALYDDPVRGAKGFKGSYLNYAGSGFQHLIHVQRLTAGADTFVAEYVHDRDPNARIRLRVLPQASQELIMADARVSPIKFPELVKYLIARRTAAPGAPDLASTFATVLEPFATTPYIASVQRRDLAAGTAVTVTRSDGERDVVIHHARSDAGVLACDAAMPLTTDAEVAVVTFDAANRPTREFFAGGTFLQVGAQRLTAAPFAGTITAIDFGGNRLCVRPAAGAPWPEVSHWAGRVLQLSNSLRETAETITAARRDGDQVWLTLKDDLRVGLVRVGSVAGARVGTKSGLRIFGIYRGVTVCSRADAPLATVAQATEDSLTLTAPAPGQIAAGEDVWLVDGAVGETVRLPAIGSWTQPPTVTAAALPPGSPAPL